MSRHVYFGFVVLAVATISVPLEVDAQSAAKHEPVALSAADEAGFPGVREEREAKVLRMRAMEDAPLAHADSQLFTVDGTYWIRHRGEKRFHPATVLRLPRDPQKGDVPVIEGPAAAWLLANGIDGWQLGPSSKTGSSGTHCPLFGTAEAAEHDESISPPPTDFPPLHPGHKSWLKAVPNDQVIFHDAFEDGFPGTKWSALDANPGFGNDFWDDVACHSHYGKRSVWCAGHGAQDRCSTVYWGMESEMFTNPLIPIGDHTDVRVSYWSWQEINTFNASCNLISMFSEDGYTWILSVLHYFGVSNEWSEEIVDLSDFSTTGYLGIKFHYLSDILTIPNAGAYIDDVLVFGCPILGKSKLTTPSHGTYICAGEGEWWCWDPVPEASSYDIQWDDTPAFLSPEQAQATGTCYHRSLSAGTYWWRAAPRTSCGGGIWSKPRQVFVVEGPDTPWLTSPQAGATVFSGSPESYTWDATPNATQYTVQWDNDPGFADPVASQTVFATQAVQTLNGLGQWYWRVLGDNAACGGHWSTPRAMNLIVNPDLIFADDFESGGLGTWSAEAP